jgi:hypothetical protein
LRTIRELSPPSWSFVFTHFLNDSVENHAYLNELRVIAADRSAQFHAVVLSCDPVELARRVPSPERRSRNKLTDPERLPGILGTSMLVPSDSLQLDVTTSPVNETADRILWSRALGVSSPSPGVDGG